MSFKSKKIKLLAVTLAVALFHLSIVAVPAAPQQVLAKLITQGGPARVNGNDTPNGTTIVSGATIETPANVAATVQIGELGLVELTPGSIVVIEFTGNNIKVTLKKGCVALTTNKGTTGSLVDSKGTVLPSTGEAEEGAVGDPDYRRMTGVPSKSDGQKRRRFPVCGIIPAGATEVVAPTAVAVAAGPVAAAGAGAGLSGAAIGAIVAGVVGGAVIAGIIGTRGGNNSPSN